MYIYIYNILCIIYIIEETLAQTPIFTVGCTKCQMHIPIYEECSICKDLFCMACLPSHQKKDVHL